MANDASRVGILDGLIRDAGIPIDGISVVDVNATPPVVTVQYRPEATAEQIALGDQIKDAFDWRKRRSLDRVVVVVAINNLTVAQRAIIDAHMRAEYLRANPILAAQIGTAAGVPLPVDEVDPN